MIFCLLFSPPLFVRKTRKIISSLYMMRMKVWLPRLLSSLPREKFQMYLCYQAVSFLHKSKLCSLIFLLGLKLLRKKIPNLIMTVSSADKGVLDDGKNLLFDMTDLKRALEAASPTNTISSRASIRTSRPSSIMSVGRKRAWFSINYKKFEWQ